MDEADHISNDSAEETSPLLPSNGETAYYSNTHGRDRSPSAILERPEDYTSRWRSIRLMYLVMFLASVTFTITMSSLWPFLQVLNPSSSTSFLGWVVAAYSVGQLVASPFFGGWANLRSSSREPLTVSLMLTILSNIFYMYLESLPSHRDYFMILARGLIGFSAGNVAVVRSYMAGATTVQERTACMANLSICQAMGFILGPVLQTTLVPISYPGPVESAYFHLNMYTAPALLSACVATISLLFLIFMFKEYRVFDDDVREILQNRSIDVEASQSVNGAALTDSLKQIEYQLDYVAVFSTIFLFFGVLFLFTVFETIGTPLTMDMYAWSKTKATLYQGIILGVAGLLSIMVFMLVKILAKKFSERYLLLGGFTFCLFGYFTLIPWGNRLPPIGYIPINQSVSSTDAIFALSDFIMNNHYSNSPVIPAHKISHRQQRAASFGSHNPEFINSYKIPVTGVYNSTNHLVNVKNKSDGDTSIAFINTDVRDKQDRHNLETSPITEASTTTISILKTTVATANTTSFVANSTSAPNGCPWEYEWCRHVPMIYLAQFLGGTALISIGYPVCNMLTYALYSKILGPKPQGLWMGWLTASGSLARVVGPIYVSQVYDSFGPLITFSSCCGFIALTIVFFIAVFRRIVPFSFKDKSLSRFAASTSEGQIN